MQSTDPHQHAVPAEPAVSAAKSLTAKLDAAEKHDGPLGAYVLELEAQSGKSLTAEQAKLLAGLTASLKQ